MRVIISRLVLLFCSQQRYFFCWAFVRSQRAYSFGHRALSSAGSSSSSDPDRAGKTPSLGDLLLRRGLKFVRRVVSEHEDPRLFQGDDVLLRLEFESFLRQLRIYKEAFNSTTIPANFVVPSTSPHWPKLFWRFALGRRNRLVERDGLYVKAFPSWQAEVEAEGFSGFHLFRNRIVPSPSKYVGAPEPLTLRLYSWDNLFKEAQRNGLSAAHRTAVQTVAILEYYEFLFGSANNVSTDFVVPAKNEQDGSASIWPEEYWEFPLGLHVSMLRSHALTLRRILPGLMQKCDSLGFIVDEEERAIDNAMQDLAVAVLEYRVIMQNDTLPSNFVVPLKAPWREEIRGKPLGEELQRFSQDPHWGPVFRRKLVGEEERRGRQSTRGSPEILSRASVVVVEEEDDDDFSSEQKLDTSSSFSLVDADISFLPKYAQYILEEIAQAHPEESELLKNSKRMKVFSPKVPFPHRKVDICKKLFARLNTTNNGTLVPRPTRLESEGGLQDSEFGGDWAFKDVVEAVKFYEDSYRTSINAIPSFFTLKTTTGFWPNEWLGMPLGKIASNFRNGDIDAKDHWLRKPILDAVHFDWGDGVSYLNFTWRKFEEGCHWWAKFRGHPLTYFTPNFEIPDVFGYSREVRGLKFGFLWQQVVSQITVIQRYHPEKWEFIQAFNIQPVDLGRILDDHEPTPRSSLPIVPETWRAQMEDWL